MKTKVKTSQSVGPEDVRVGDYLTTTRVTVEFLPDVCDPYRGRTVEPMRCDIMPWCAGTPMRVEAVCVPFVYVRTPSGDREAIDLRRYSVVRLAPTYGQKAFKTLDDAEKKAKRKAKRKRRKRK